MEQLKAETRGSSWKILVVNNRATLSDSSYELLGLWGHRVQQVTSDAEVSEQVASFRPDLILIDMQAVGINGYEVAKSLRRERTTPKVVLVALTHQSGNEQGRLLTQAGFDYYLNKPLKAATLISLLDRLKMAPPAK